MTSAPDRTDASEPPAATPPAPAPTTPTEARPHGGTPRGLDNTPTSSSVAGRFGRMFRQVPVYEQDHKALYELAATMIQGFEGGEGDTHSSTPAARSLDKRLQKERDEDENWDLLDDGTLRLPAGYTYFGQFVDHDITFDPVSSLTRQNDPDALTNFRTPRFDLDSLYGAGPANQPYLYAQDGVRLLLEPSNADLQRNSAGRALIGDPRNDENVIVSQFQVAFIRFHNAVVDRLEKKPGLKDVDLLKLAQQNVRWHYQWVVVHDFLPRIVGDRVRDANGKAATNRVVDHILNVEDYEAPNLRGGGENQPAIPDPKLRFYEWKVRPYMPVEFSVAAYRFGHSMARPSYLISDEIDGPGIIDVGGEKVNVNRIPLFDLADPKASTSKNDAKGRLIGAKVGGRLRLNDLSGFGKLRPGVRVQWKYLLPGIKGEGRPNTLLPQPSYKIDATIGRPLSLLPENIAKAQSLFGAPEEQARSLAARNLLRARALGVPSGQDVARAMGVEPLAPLDKSAEGWEDERPLRKVLRNYPELAGRWPLWYYVLKEAERNDGAYLGPVGGRIVAEVLIGLLWGDPLSYLSVDPGWRPNLGPTKGEFTLSDLINEARKAKPVAA